MILIWGSRTRQKHEFSFFQTMPCRVCQNYTVHVISIRTWFTFFFIPVFPTNAKKYYLHCSTCENGMRLEDDLVKDLLANVNSEEKEDTEKAPTEHPEKVPSEVIE